MLYDLIGRLARSGGNVALGALFVISIVNLAIVCDRLWLFFRQRFELDRFATRFTPLLSAQKWSEARTLAQQCVATPSTVVLTGLTRISQGPASVRAAMRSSAARERLRLENYLELLRALGHAALLIGVLGAVLDLWQFLRLPSSAGVDRRLLGDPKFAFTLASLAAGLVVAIPAMFMANVLSSHVRRTLDQTEFLAELVVAHLEAASELHTRSSERPSGERPSARAA